MDPGNHLMKNNKPIPVRALLRETECGIEHATSYQRDEWRDMIDVNSQMPKSRTHRADSLHLAKKRERPEEAEEDPKALAGEQRY